MPRPTGADLARFRATTTKSTLKPIQDELSSIEPTRRAQAGRIANSTPRRYQPLYFRALRGELSPRQAIKVMCYSCVAWGRAEAYCCTAGGCPLWAYRPRVKRSAEAEESPEP